MVSREEQGETLTEVEHCVFDSSPLPHSTPIPCGFVYVRRLCCVSVINEITLFLLLLLLLPPPGISCFCLFVVSFCFCVIFFYYNSLLLLLLLSCLFCSSSGVVARWHADSRFNTEFDFVFGSKVYLLLLELLTVYLLSSAEPSRVRSWCCQLCSNFKCILRASASASDFLDSFDYCYGQREIFAWRK